MNSDSDLNLLKESARKAASLVGRYDFVRVLTHYDADGISAGAIVASALLRANKGFQLTFLKGLNESFEYERDELLIFLDMGSGYPDVISSVEADVIVLDHHLPTGKINAKKEFVHVNPHLYGFDGTYELSASGVAYFFANELGNNRDLSSIALVGIIGDKQKLLGPNEEILKSGIEWGVIEEKPGVCLHSGKLRDVLSRSIEPYLDLYKKDDELESFLKKAKLDGEKEFDDLSIDEMHRLANAVTLRLLKMGAYEGVIEQIIGRRFILKNLPIVNAHMLTDIVNSCGRAGAMGVAFGILAGDKSFVEKAVRINYEYTTEILEELAKRKREVKEGFCIRYLVMNDAPSASSIATTFSRYLMSDKPIVVINVKNGKAKVSARTTEKLSRRVNLAEVMKIAAEKVGGRGGGHRVAAGANLSPDKIDEFLKEVDRLCCAMLA